MIGDARRRCFKGRSPRGWLAAALLGLLAVVTQVDPTRAQMDSVIAAGAADYQADCVACHGNEARGDGPMAAILTLPPTDLTQIAKTNDGLFPFWRVYAIIDGSEAVTGHETFQMPQYKERYAQDATKPGYLPGYVRVLLLTHYLDSIQTP